MPQGDLNQEGIENAFEQPDSMMQSPMEAGAETTAANLEEHKDELQQIIERNRQQVEQNDGLLGESSEGMVVEPERVEQKIDQLLEQGKDLGVEQAKQRIHEQFDKETKATMPAKEDDEDQQAVAHHAKTVYEISDPEQQIEKLVQLAVTKDPFHAIKVAQHLDDNYILNEVHDRLVEDKVRDELIKCGLIKAIE